MFSNGSSRHAPPLAAWGLAGVALLAFGGLPGRAQNVQSLNRPASSPLLEPSLGKRVFEGACASCHGFQSQQLQAAATDPSGAIVVQMVLNGIGTPMEPQFMPRFGRAYSNAEIAAVANYVVHHFGGKKGEVTPADVGKQRTPE
jgi:mono/diheme cytochrome c family protein